MSEPEFARIEQLLGHRFSRPELIERALTHRSAVADYGSMQGPGHNEQLEYLGDAVLGMLVSDYLIAQYPGWSEGQLSKGRARIVKTASLCAAARRLGLGLHLRLGRGEEKTGGREKPALLANVFEAVVAAIYLDGGLAAAQEFVARALLKGAIEAHGSRLENSDCKSALQEFLQARGLPPARYNVVRESGPDHRKTFWVEVHAAGRISATGMGTNKKEAEQSAAEQALEQLLSETA